MLGNMDLGGWRRFIRSGGPVYSKLPGRLGQDLANYRPDGGELEPLSPDMFARIQMAIRQEADRLSGYFKPAYHNSGHFARVEACGLAAADAYAAGHLDRLPLLVRQAFQLALYAHDAGHSGSTFRFDSRVPIYLPSFANYSAEWVSAYFANNILELTGVNPLTRLFVVSIIWSSTFGGQTERGESLGIPSVQPQTILEAIMLAADVCPEETFEQSIKQSVRVNYCEVPAQPAPQTFAGFVDSQLGFFGYVGTRLDQLDIQAGSELAAKLGWRQRLKEFVSRMNDAKTSPNGRNAQDIRAILNPMGLRFK